MRSISLINHQNYSLPEFNSNEVKLAHDPVNNITYLVGLNSGEETCRVWSYKTEGTNKIYKEIIDFPFMNLDNQATHLTGFDYLVNSELLCVALSNGDIVTIDINQSMPQTDVVGTVDFGILSMIWSLDQELVAIITGHENFLLMTKDFEVIKEQPLHLDDQGIEIPVSVGWGKKETQFHGSVGKQAAKEKVNVADFTLSKDEDHLPKVSWRGDGSYLVISIINPLTGIRQLKVFSREGDLINVSEPVDKLEHLVNWRPSGNLITCSQRSPPNRHEIIFFERNGLRHGEFTLPKNVEKLIQIGWNCDSTILGLLLIYNNPNGLQDYRLQLWTMGNYHYYLKQEIIIGIVGSGQVNEIEFVWDTERFNGLNIAYLGNIHSVLLHLEALTSSVLTPIEPMGLVSVVDGSQLLITPYKYKNVPPPMSAYQIPTQSQIQHVSYSTFNHGNDILVLLNDSKVGLITFDGPKSTPVLGAEFLDLNSLDLPQINYRQITYPKKDEIYLLGYSEDAMSDIVVRVQIECSDARWNDQVKVIGQTFNTIDSSIIKLNHFENLPYPLIQDGFGDFYQVKSEENEIKFTQGIDQLPAFKFPEACSRYSVFKGNDSDDEIYFVGLSSRNKLYINDQLVESGCTSFTMHNEFLLFTTSDHLVKFIYWKGLYENQFNIQNYVNLLEPYHRKLERGSKLVVTVPGDVNVVIQMPRGNLETVYPRALVVANVLNHVTNLRYDLAFIQCRKHRIDHNIIYDFNPQQLLDNLALFVDQVKDPDYLNLFLSSMTNKNVLKELYPPMMPKSLEDGDKLAELFATKRDLLCIGVRDVLRTKPGKEYYPTVMTTYVRQVPPNLEDALELLKSIKVNNIDLAEETLKYAIFLVNVEQLFDCALGLYDFELVLMVAQQSNMDPKEYLPFLDGLKQFKAPYQYFKIDDHLKRHGKALSHLYNSGDDYWTEFLNYCKANTLYTTALNLASKNNEQLKQIRKIYGDHLISLKDYLNAGPMYLLCQEYESALLCFVKLGNWQFAYQCARQLKYTEEKTNELIKDLVDKLKDQEKFGEAAKLIMDHFNDPEEALPIYIEGRLWSDGLYLCHFHNRLDLIETDLQPQVTEGYDQLFEDISDMLTQFRKQNTRLDELRKELTQIPVYDNIQNNEALDNVDITSEASTNITNFTVYTKISSQASTVTGSVRTGKTSRDRKRAAKSKQKGKKGSYHEEEYLIGSIGRLVKRFNDLQRQVHSMLMILVNFGTISKAQTLQKEYLALELELTSKLDQVYEFSPRLQAELKEATTPQDPGLDRVNLTLIKWKLEILN